jgi:predicted outer membrane repeat protein
MAGNGIGDKYSFRCAELCEAGKYNPSLWVTEGACALCPSGKYSDSLSLTCPTCDINHYSSSGGSSSCDICPGDKTAGYGKSICDVPVHVVANQAQLFDKISLIDGWISNDDKNNMDNGDVARLSVNTYMCGSGGSNCFDEHRMLLVDGLRGIIMCSKDTEVGNHPDADGCVLDAKHERVIMQVDSTDSGILVLRSLIFKRGHTGWDASFWGGPRKGGELNFVFFVSVVYDLVSFVYSLFELIYCSSGYGGAIYLKEGELDVVLCTFTKNSAWFKGGAIFVEDSGTFFSNIARLYLYGCHFPKDSDGYGNSSPKGNDVYVDAGSKAVVRGFDPARAFYCSKDRWEPEMKGSSSSKLKGDLYSYKCYHSCPPGWVNKDKAMTSDGCQKCPGGKFSEKGQSECDVCEIGKWSDEGQALSCHECPAGRYNTADDSLGKEEQVRLMFSGIK